MLSSTDVAAGWPLLDRGLESICGATFSPRDGLVNPNAVRAWYRAEAERGGARFRDRDYLVGVRTSLVVGSASTSRPLRRITAVDLLIVDRQDPLDEAGYLRDLLTTHRVAREAIVGEERIVCDVLVNCLGAWSPILASKIGVRDVTQPVRRQISLVDVHAQDIAEGVDLDALGMIVDASGLYLHPEGPYILAGYSNPAEPPGFGFEYDGEGFFEREIWPRLAARASSFERCGHVRGWAGLYAETPDRSGIAGALDGLPNLFEAHSFTGRGVMQSAGIARAMAALIDTGRFEAIDLSPLARDRFDDPARWMVEDLHI